VQKSLIAALASLTLLCSYVALAQQSPAPSPSMNFFVTSATVGDGGDLGGLAGAGAHCQALATAVGAGRRTWHAYMSTQVRPGQPAVNARDRIGTGPWYSFKGEMIAPDLAHLHGDTLELARLGNNLNKLSGLTEKGDTVPGLYDYPDPRDNDWDYAKTTPHSSRHEMLTGSQPDGTAFSDGLDHTCNNWTSNKRLQALRPGTSMQPTAGPTPRSVFPTATVAAMDPGIRLTEREAAPKRTCPRRTASACSTVLRLTRMAKKP